MNLNNEAMANLRKPNLYDLFEAHALARGAIVKGREKAKRVFGVDDGITPFDTDVIMSEFL